MLSSLYFASILLTAAAAPTKRAVPDFTYAGDAGWTVDTETLANSMTCPHGAPTAASPPVLLVHGTAASGNDTWSETYVPALLSNGYTACYLELRKFETPHIDSFPLT